VVCVARLMVYLKTRIYNKLGIEGWWIETVRGFQVPVRGGPDFVGLSNTRFFDTASYRWLQTNVGHLDGWVIDVGAFIGEFALTVADLYGNNVRYLGFEPSVNAAAYTKKLLESNRLEHGCVFPFALWRERRLLTLFRDAEYASGAMLTGELAADARFRKDQVVLALAGDSILPDLMIDAVALLKVDVEGAELEVLEGLRRTLTRDRPTVIFEALPTGHHLYPAVIPITNAEERQQRRRRLQALEALLRELGLIIAHIERDGTSTPVPHLVDAVDAIRDIDLVNFVALPECSRGGTDSSGQTQS